MTDATVRLWGRDIGAVTWVPSRAVGVFQYAPEFVGSRIEIAPLTMPLSTSPYEFPGLSRETFKGLPGLLADSLPDAFGNAVINAWLATQGRTAASFNPVERLCYVGTRGMGALEFEPATNLESIDTDVEVAALVALASRVLADRGALQGTLHGTDDTGALQQILKVGTSAGGARAKAVLGWNPRTGEFRSGQVRMDDGFEPWILKFDGVTEGNDRELTSARGYGLIEYAYSLMASAAGVEMAECRLHRENGRAHFMTRRFDRTAEGAKVHMQSLGAMRHFDFNQAGAHSYEQALNTAKRLALPVEDLHQQFRRAVFNVVARNQDDHVKNIAYLMNPAGEWRLSPAFDVVYAYNPQGQWTKYHQMTVNGKSEHLVLDDLLALGAVAGLKRARSLEVVEAVVDAVRQWPEFAAGAGLTPEGAHEITGALRTDIMGG